MGTPAFDPSLLPHHIREHRLFGRLGASGQAMLAAGLRLQHAGDGDRLEALQGPHAPLRWLICGELDLLDAQHRCVASLRPGDVFGHGPNQPTDAHLATARSDCTLGAIDAQLLQALLESAPWLACLLPREGAAPATAEGLETRHRNSDPALTLMNTAVRALVRRAPVALAPQATIRQAAALMHEQRVSSVLIMESGHLVGLVTDRDLRNRVIAAGLDTARPIADVLTPEPVVIEAASPAFEALLLMTRHNIHHLPVRDAGQTVGMITASDLTAPHSTSAVYLVGDVHKQTELQGLQRVSSKIGLLQQQLAAAKASADNSGHMLTAITDALTVRLLQLAEARLGPPPVEYVWVAAGSQARNEQTAKSDQDNCMVLDDTYDATAHGAYFQALAQFVCDGLHACGYVHCPGDIMAMNDAWRQPRARWIDCFARWTGQPDPHALMLTCVFFDMRAISGSAHLLDGLRQDVLRRTQGNSIFLAHMVGNALTHQPPLGLFKGLSTLRSGANKGTIDLKHSGIVPIVDLARVYALAGGDGAVNTHDRLLGSAAGGAISEQSARDLRDALEFLAFARIQHQARQMERGEAPDNFLHPGEISNFERTQLKDAFTVVQTLQSVLGQRYSF